MVVGPDIIGLFITYWLARLGCADVVLIGPSRLGSASYGYTVGQSFGYGYVRNPAGVDRQCLEAAHHELELANGRVFAHLFRRAPRPAKRALESEPEEQ